MTRFLALAAALLACTPLALQAQDAYPSRPIHIVVSTPPGGVSDAIARILGEAMAQELKQPLIVDNKVGASGSIGANAVAKAPPDGYTILLGTGSTQVVAAAMMKGIPYDTVRDFEPLSVIGRSTFVVFTSPATPAKNLRELVALARAKPGELNFGTTGPGTIYEVAALQFEALAQVQVNHVPYKGLAPLVLDVAAGRIDAAVGPLDGFSKSDKVRPLAVLGSRRLPALPDLPTTAEAGLPGFEVPVWAGLFAPAGTPAAIVRRLSDATRVALARRDVQDRITATGLDPDWKDETALRRLVAEDIQAMRELMRKAKIEPQ